VPSTVVVREGDTLWSIAGRVAPHLDVRVAVDRLVAANGGAPLVPGQVLEVPSG
jgi:Tfp pilus assembly protein FimV